VKRFHVNLANPSAGGLPITISGDGGRIEIVASYTPRDSFTDLVSSVLHLYRTGSETEVIFNEEPEQRWLRLRKDGDRLVVECSKGNQLETVTAGFDTGCRELALRFKLLLESIGYDGFAEEWRHRPPKQEIAELWSCFAQRGRGSRRGTGAA
jgi:hypothetical protein